jgi:hypothetical protein
MAVWCSGVSAAEAYVTEFGVLERPTVEIEERDLVIPQPRDLFIMAQARLTHDRLYEVAREHCEACRSAEGGQPGHMYPGGCLSTVDEVMAAYMGGVYGQIDPQDVVDLLNKFLSDRHGDG